MFKKKRIFKTTDKPIKVKKPIFSNIFKALVNIFKFIFTELILIIKNLGLGIFGVFSFLFNLIKAIFIFLYKTLIKIFKWLYKTLIKFFKWLYKAIIVFFKWLYKIFKSFFIEIYIFFKSFFFGIYFTLKFLLYEIPKFFLKALASFYYMIYKKIKRAFEMLKERFKDLPGKIKNFFVKKWNNLALVKYYRNKRERELEVLYIDMNSEDAKRSQEKHTYKYLARNKEGKLIKGYFPALSKLDTHSYLLDKGYEVYEIETSKWIDFFHGQNTTRRMNNKDLVFWLAQLSTYVKSGIPLTDAVKILAKQDRKKSHKKIYDSIIYELTMGESFSEALKRQGNVYPALLINMIKAAEMIGDIESTLDEMSTYYKEVEETKKAMISAMTYPLIILIFAIVVVVFILVYIIPQFVSVYEQAGANLPGITIFVLGASAFLRKNYLYIIGAVIILIVGYVILYKKVKAFRTAMQYIYMHLPVVGKIIIYKEMNLFSKTFAALQKNNILLTDSIDILSKITNNEMYKMIMFDTISNLLRGDKMSKSFENNWAVPDLAYYMITTGESTGELASMLEKVSDYYQGEQKNIVNTLKTFIEPIMIAFLAVIVGGIVMSIIIPMFGLYGQIS